MKNHKLFLFIITSHLLSLLGHLQAEGAPTMTLKDCLDQGLSQYVPLKLADEELELARIKKEEALRAYFPALSMKGEQTNGDTTGNQLGFVERVYGASLSHNFYEGGKIHATFKQAADSFESAKISRDKTYQDFIFNVKEAYWNLVAASQNLSEREKTQNVIREDLKKITEQYVLDLTVKQQFLAVKAQYLQSNNQLNQARKSFAKAKWDLAKAMGDPKPVDKPLVATIPFKKLDIQLDPCFALASAHRPDLKMQEFLVDMARQGKTIANATYKPRLTLNSFYGRSASAFENDPLNYKDDWQLNVNLAQSFWGNSLSLSGGAVNTSPKVGESTRTKTKTRSAHMNILDGMKNRTETKQADLNYRQAKLKEDDLKKDIAVEVETSFYNVTQALLQVEFSEEDEKLAAEELAITESKGRYGITGVLEMAQARNRLSQSRAAKLEALAGYQIALSALNRAIGIPDQFIAE